MLADSHLYEDSLLKWWLTLSLAGGIVMLLIGARAVGLALLGAVLGAFTAFFLNPNLDLFPTSLPIGASIGLVVGGVVGLRFRERLPSPVLRWMGILTAVMGLISVVVIHRAAATICTYPLLNGNVSHGRSCLPSWGLLAQALFALDAVLIAALFFASSARAQRSGLPRSQRTSGLVW